MAPHAFGGTLWSESRSRAPLTRDGLHWPVRLCALLSHSWTPTMAICLPAPPGLGSARTARRGHQRRWKLEQLQKGSARDVVRERRGLLEDHSSELISHHLSCKRGKTKPLPTTSTCTPGSVVSAPLCSSVNTTTLTGLCDTHSHAPFRHKSLFFPLNANTKDWSDIEPDTLTNSCLPQPEYDQLHGALLFRFSESNFGDTANFEVNALYRDACSSSNEGRAFSTCRAEVWKLAGAGGDRSPNRDRIPPPSRPKTNTLPAFFSSTSAPTLESLTTSKLRTAERPWNLCATRYA